MVISRVDRVAYRTYNPVSMRWLTPDPAQDGTNWYQYVNGDPVNLWDPLGLCDEGYNRNKAVEYAVKWSDPSRNGKVYNPEYERFDTLKYKFETGQIHSGDCANYTSQCLVAGGVDMNKDWHYKQKPIVYETIPSTRRVIGHRREMIAAWASANAQYEYFSDKDNGYSSGTITAKSPEKIKEIANSGDVKKGDLAYWDWESDGDADHATIISEVGDGKILYAGHTNDRQYADMALAMREDNSIYIVKMK